ncbi:hypothetical protein caldi_30370 [Caldinitratiruptor microaerophilus]|uniref:Uncharacterized protein n=1 Tax=Caldinitratiruptor microaerophilus TaxID=671077 RepID=A0AA35CPU2_9FIRM|nr:hypothetical protein caldi_30370 [Caldinitratiruptor microaerophilus]
MGSSGADVADTKGGTTAKGTSSLYARHVAGAVCVHLPGYSIPRWWVPTESNSRQMKSATLRVSPGGEAATQLGKDADKLSVERYHRPLPVSPQRVFRVESTVRYNQRGTRVAPGFTVLKRSV